MNDRDRVIRMRTLRDRLERLPASPERDRMLTEVRRRAVDIESGVTPAAVRPLVTDSSSPARAPAAAKKLGPLPPTRRVAPVQAPVAPVRNDFIATTPSVAAAALPEGLRLCLDDEVVDSVEPRRHQPTSPWARGLRG